MINAASGGLMEGIEAVRAGPAADAPDYDVFLTRLHEVREPDPTDEIAYAGWAGGRLLEATLLRLDGDLTRDRLLEELESTEDRPLEVDPYPPIWFGQDRRFGSTAVVPSRVEDGQWVVTGEPASRFD